MCHSSIDQVKYRPSLSHPTYIVDLRQSDLALVIYFIYNVTW
jgi:hypothetical protein